VLGDSPTERFPKLKTNKYPSLPDEITFLHAEEILDMYPRRSTQSSAETMIVQKYSRPVIIGIGWTLQDGYPHEMRAADYDELGDGNGLRKGRPMHGLNGDILVWNPVTRRRHELMVRRHPCERQKPLETQLQMTGQLDWLKLPYHPGHRQEPDPSQHRRRHRPIPHHHASSQKGSSRRGERYGLAQDPQGHMREENIHVIE